MVYVYIICGVVLNIIAIVIAFIFGEQCGIGRERVIGTPMSECKGWTYIVVIFSLFSLSVYGMMHGMIH